MNISSLRPIPVNKIEFNLSKLKFSPTESGCYILTNFFDEIMYIGQADNLQRRMKNHLENPHKTGLTEIGKAYWFWYMTFDPNNLSKLERGWLNLYELNHGKLPFLNSIHAPI